MCKLYFDAICENLFFFTFEGATGVANGEN